MKKNVDYGGIYQYVMLKDKTVNGIRRNIIRYKKYTDEQILLHEPEIDAEYINIAKDTKKP